MKKIFLIAFAALAVFASCNKEISTNTPEVEFPEGEKAYLAVGIDLPSATASKADGTNYGEYNDGTADAANVEDIILVLFKGTSEASSEVASAYNLSEYRNTFATNSYDQVTVSSSKIIAEVQKSTLGTDNVYALIILNDHGFYQVEGYNLVATDKGNFVKGVSNPDGSMTNVAPAKTTLTGKSFAEIQALLIDESSRNYGETSFMMTNATYVKGGNVATLVPVTANIYSSRVAAEQNPAATINVERVLAKVQVTWADGLKVANSKTDMPIEVTAWDLDNVNTIAYLTKNFDSNWKAYPSFLPTDSTATGTPKVGVSRMVDPRGIESVTGPSFRTHWAIDPNYTGSTQTYTLFTHANQSDIAIERKKNAIYYCPENTFDVTNMSDINTTRLVIKTKLNEGKDFYTVTENATVLYQNDVENAGEGSIQEYIYAALANKKEIRSWMETYSLTGKISEYVSLALTQAYYTSDDEETREISAVVTDWPVPGRQVVSFTVKSTVAEAAKTAFATLATENDAYFAKSYKFYYYKSGVAFYQALIKHFGDHETPWKQVDGMVNVTTGTNGVYASGLPTPEERYLGRYGIVRNNWYNINVKGIRNIGSAVVPDLPGRPDDTVENFIAIEINIMPWVMRPQDVIL